MYLLLKLAEVGSTSGAGLRVRRPDRWLGLLTILSIKPRFKLTFNAIEKL
jgi:hypothetical protein